MEFYAKIGALHVTVKCNMILCCMAALCVFVHVCKEELFWFEMSFIGMILYMRCTQIDFEGVGTVCGLNFGSPHVPQPPYVTELTWLTIESCYHI